MHLKFSFYLPCLPTSCFIQGKFKDTLDSFSILDQHDFSLMNSIPSNMFFKNFPCQSHCIIERQEMSLLLPLLLLCNPHNSLANQLLSCQNAQRSVFNIQKKIIIPLKKYFSSGSQGAYKHVLLFWIHWVFIDWQESLILHQFFCPHCKHFKFQ